MVVSCLSPLDCLTFQFAEILQIQPSIEHATWCHVITHSLHGTCTCINKHYHLYVLAPPLQQRAGTLNSNPNFHLSKSEYGKTIL